MTTHRFQPRYRGVAWTSIGVGGALGAVAAAIGFSVLPLATGAAGIALGAAYLTSRAWKIEVVADDAGIEVRTPKGTRFRLAWSDVVRVVASPSTKTCFVDGGSPERSLLVPGDGAPAPYSISDREALFQAILAHVPAERIETVETLEQADATRKPA